MATSTWKAVERAYARLYIGKRVPSSGNGAIKGDNIDMAVLPGMLGEVKHGQQVNLAGPKAMMAWLAEAERDARTADADGAVMTLHFPRQRYEDGLVVTRAGNMRAIYDHFAARAVA